MVDQFSEADNRAQNWERDIKGFAPKRYVMKEIFMAMTTSAWTNSFYQKTATSLTAGTGSAIKGIARGADFPSVVRGTTLVNSVIEQYGGEGVIYWQDILTSNIAVQAETILDVTDAIVNAVDGNLYNVLTENDTPVNINTLAIAAGSEWDSATVANRDPVQNLLIGEGAMMTNNYDVLANGYILMLPVSYASLLRNS
ncbi:MAG: hypothetical protein KAK00_11055, partial [Nanoarchaeota archaeon]|nr:hypothetical protein [Nanoarchaeota archaeon]